MFFKVPANPDGSFPHHVSVQQQEFAVEEGLFKAPDHFLPHCLVAGFEQGHPDDESKLAEPRADEPAPPLADFDIDTAKRSRLFAALRELGVGVSPPITNDDLRALVRQGLADRAAAGTAAGAQTSGAQDGAQAGAAAQDGGAGGEGQAQGAPGDAGGQASAGGAADGADTGAGTQA